MLTTIKYSLVDTELTLANIHIAPVKQKLFTHKISKYGRLENTSSGRDDRPQDSRILF